MLFKFAQMTDSHLYAPTTGAPRAVRDAAYVNFIREVAANGIDFIIHTGDFVNGGLPAEDHRRYRAIWDETCRELGIGYHLVRGNHDTMESDDAYENVYGKGTYLFRHKGWAFLCVDRYYRTYQHTLHAYAMSAET